MTIKIALVRPKYHSHLITPPLGPGYLSSTLKSAGREVTFIDGLRDDLTEQEIVRACADSDIVGLSCLSDYYAAVIRITHSLKARGKTVILGGPHATALPGTTLSDSGADHVVVGEGERTIVELVDSIEEGGGGREVPGTIRDPKEPTLPRTLIDDLDSLPFPDWEQMDPRSYPKAPHGGFVKRFPVAPVATTRGCPFDCSFCASPTLWGRTIRFRSPENVVDEIETLVRSYGVREIHFEDDNLTLKRNHIERICDLLIDRAIDVSWATPNGIRAETLDDELLGLMGRSGCYSLAFGIESGSQVILDKVSKNIHLEEVGRAVTLAHNHGILTQGFFIFGLPGETHLTIRRTVEYAKSLPLDKAQFLLLDILPGSRLWEELDAGSHAGWTGRSYQEVKWLPDGMDEDTLRRAPSRAFRSFFLRPRQLWLLMRYLKIAQIPYVVKRLKDFNIFRRSGR